MWFRSLLYWDKQLIVWAKSKRVPLPRYMIVPTPLVLCSRYLLGIVNFVQVFGFGSGFCRITFLHSKSLQHRCFFVTEMFIFVPSFELTKGSPHLIKQPPTKSCNLVIVNCWPRLGFRSILAQTIPSPAWLTNHSFICLAVALLASSCLWLPCWTRYAWIFFAVPGKTL